MDAAAVGAWLSGAALLAGNVALLVKNARRPPKTDHTIEYVESALTDAVRLRGQVEKLQADVTKNWEDGLDARLQHAKCEAEKLELANANHRLRTLVARYEAVSDGIVGSDVSDDQ